MKEQFSAISSYAEKCLVVAFALFFILPASLAEAGILSFLLSSPSSFASGESMDVNSQNMHVLQAARNINPNSAKGGGGITIVGGTALLAEIGPSGSLADIEEHPKSDQISIYVVRPGDSLSQIAEMFGVSVNTIIWSNDIPRGSLITPGETLTILPISGVRHRVVSGDTIQSIAKKYNGDVEDIIRYNDLRSGQVLAVGTIVIVPDGEVTVPVSGVRYADRVSGGDTTTESGGYYLRPIVGGYRSQGLHGYNGVDLAAPYGTPLLASAAGDVIVSENADWNGGYGKYVVIKHGNGTQTLYAHASEVIVYSGTRVVKGQVIGYVGSTGKSTGSHVHFEVRGARNPF